jgi:hypothetical protein
MMILDSLFCKFLKEEGKRPFRKICHNVLSQVEHFVRSRSIEILPVPYSCSLIRAELMKTDHIVLLTFRFL